MDKSVDEIIDKILNQSKHVRDKMTDDLINFGMSICKKTDDKKIEYVNLYDPINQDLIDKFNKNKQK